MGDIRHAQRQAPARALDRHEIHHLLDPAFGRPGGYGEGFNTRSHPELGRENPQRRWYCVLRRGRVGRRQVFQARGSDVRYQVSVGFLIPDPGPSNNPIHL